MEKEERMAEDITMSTVESGAQTVDTATAADGVVVHQEESASEKQQETDPAGGGNGEGKPAVQKRSDNAQMKGLRKKAEAYDGMSAGVMALARAKGLQPKDAREAMTMLQAEAAGKTHEDYLADEKAAEDRFKGTDTYRRMAADAEAYRVQKAKEEDLKAIQAVDSSITSLEQLGEEYGDLILRMDALEAYYYLKGKGAIQGAVKEQPITGALDYKGTVERDFTSDELDQLSAADLAKDDRLYKKAMASLLKLGKK